MLILPEFEGHRRTLDMSRWQGEVDFNGIAAMGVFDVIAIRASIGDYYTDPRFIEYYGNGNAAGFVMIPYVVVRVDMPVDPQLSRFAISIGSKKFPAIVLDVEWSSAWGNFDDVDVVDVRNRVYWMARHLNRIYKVPVFIYTADWFWSAPIHDRMMPKDPPNGLEDPEIRASGWRLFVASYGDNDTDPFDLEGQPILPTGWKEGDKSSGSGPHYFGYEWWQVTSKGDLGDLVDSENVDMGYITQESYELVAPDGPPPPPPSDLEKRIEVLEERVDDIDAWGKSYPI